MKMIHAIIIIMTIKVIQGAPLIQGPMRQNLIENSNEKIQRTIRGTSENIMNIMNNTITQLPNNITMMFEDIGVLEIYNTEWTIVLYIDLDSYNDALFALNKSIELATESCNTIKGHFPRDFCTPLIKQINKNKNEIMKRNKFLTEKRTKRSIVPFLGSLVKAAIGNLDEEDGLRYETMIENIQKNEDRDEVMLNEQLSIVKSTIGTFDNITHDMYEHMNAMKNIHGDMTHNMNKMINAINETEYESRIFVQLSNMVQYANAIVNLVSIKQQQIIDSLSFTKIDTIFPLIFPEEQLIKQLKEIQLKLPKDLSIPINFEKELDKEGFYKIINMKFRKISHKIIYEVTIPLVNDNEFKLYEAIPIPIKLGNETHITVIENQYLAINHERSSYTNLNQDDLHQCIKRGRGYVCPPNFPIYGIEVENCIKNIFMNKTTMCKRKVINIMNNLWIAKHMHEWVIKIMEESKIRLICPRHSQRIELKGLLKIKLVNQCKLQLNDITISSKNPYILETQLNTKLYKDIDTNINNDISIDKFEYINYNLTNVERHDYDNLKSKINKLHAIHIENHTKQNVHNGIVYVIIIIILTFIIIVAMLRLRNKTLKNNLNITYNVNDDKIKIRKNLLKAESQPNVSTK